MILHLQRPQPALPNSYFWTWDHSTNHVLDDPGVLNYGCHNAYMKRPETYVEDYRRLTDLAAGLGIKGIVIWGFLRDSHGGIEAAKRVACYAASRGVAIMPGVGTTRYGGCYYEGDHPYNLETFLRAHPEARTLKKDGTVYGYAGHYGICPRHPAYLGWLQEGMRWLFREFCEIGGANLENGDFMEDYHPLTLQFAESWPKDDLPFFRFQAMSYIPAVEAVRDQLADKLVTYATYTGFTQALIRRVGEENPDFTPAMGNRPPAMFEQIHPDGICQWTLTGMLRENPLPLVAYLDDGAPAAALANDNWPAGAQPPSRRSAGFIHQGSQWAGGTRYRQVVSWIKEGCLRAYRSGLEGVSIHGEVSPRFIQNALNYLAFSHFIHWPEDSLRQFGRKTLGQVLGSEEDGEAFAETLAHWDSGSVTAEQVAQARARDAELAKRVDGGSIEALKEWHFWHWLSSVAGGRGEPHTVSIS